MTAAPLPLRLSTRVALRAWFTPPPARPSSVAAAELDIEEFATPDGPLTIASAGSGPLVLFVHGWGGDPGRLGPLASAVAEAGHRVVVPHLPGRAGSDRTNLLEMAAAVRHVVTAEGRPAAVVAHSFGAMVVRLAFTTDAPDRIVLVAPLLTVSDGLEKFGRIARLMPWVRSGLRRRLEDWIPELWPVVDQVRPDQAPGARMLILHDPGDRETSFENAAALAALRPDTTIVPIPDVGHHRILADPRVVDRVDAFLGHGPDGGGDGSPADRGRTSPHAGDPPALAVSGP